MGWNEAVERGLKEAVLGLRIDSGSNGVGRASSFGSDSDVIEQGGEGGKLSCR